MQEMTRGSERFTRISEFTNLEMSKAQGKQLGEAEIEQWMKELGVELIDRQGDTEEGFHDALRDGAALCQLVNIIRPNSVEEVKCVCVCCVLVR